jgi:hypothetical protein
MNAPFYMPAEIDWTDGLNPLTRRGNGEQANPFVFDALEHDTMRALRNSDDYRVALYGAPIASFSPMPGGATRDEVLTIPPGSWLFAVKADSEQPEGFQAQITFADGGRVFDRPTGSASLSGDAGRPLYLSKPQGFPAGGPVTVRIINKSAIANDCQLVLWVAVPLTA